MDVRIYNLSELRAAAGDPGDPKIRGYAAIFNSMSEDLGGFVEVILPGAFAHSLEVDDQRSLWQHDTKMVLGRKKSGTLRLTEDEVGLHFEVDPPPTSWANDAMITMQRGDVDQASFGFDAEDDQWEQRGDLVIRYVKTARLYEVSPVTFPAYPQTSAKVRAKANEIRSAMQDPGDPAGSDGDQAAAGTQEGAGSDGSGAEADAQQLELLQLELQKKRLDLAELES